MMSPASPPIGPAVRARSRWVAPAPRPLTSLLAITWALAAAALPGLAGCSRDPQPGAVGAQAAQSAGPQRPAAPPAAVAVRPAVIGPIATYYQATATLEPEKQADVIARVSGQIVALTAEEGDRVAAGQVLLRVEPAEYRHRLQQTEAEVLKQRARHDRLKRMLESQLVAAEEYESARSDLQSAEAARDLAALELSYTDIRAPFSGHVVRRHVDLGRTVTPGAVLFTLADLALLRARVHVPAKEFRAIQTDQPVELTLDASRDTLSGRITLINPMVDPTSGTIKVTIDVTRYPPTSRPGDFANVRIVTDRHATAILVPKIAVIEEKGETIVYVASADSVAQRRPVRIGFRGDDETEILEGVAPGDWVVVQGQRTLEDGQRLKIFERLSYETAPGDARR